MLYWQQLSILIFNQAYQFKVEKPWIGNWADSDHEQLISWMTAMVLLKFIGLFTFSYGGNRNQRGGMYLWCGMQPFVVVWQHFHVAGWNFEEILQHCWSGLERLWLCLKGRVPSCKMGVITQSSGEGTVERCMTFQACSLSHFYASRNLYNEAPF